MFRSFSYKPTSEVEKQAKGCSASTRIHWMLYNMGFECLFEWYAAVGMLFINSTERILKGFLYSGVQDIIARSQRQAHNINGVEVLEVTPHYSFLKNATSKGMEVTFDPDIYKYS